MCPRPDVHSLMPANIVEHSSLHLKNNHKFSLWQAFFLCHCSKGREGTGLDNFQKLLEVDKTKNQAELASINHGEQDEIRN